MLIALVAYIECGARATKGCSGVPIAPDSAQGLCTISFAKVTQRAVSMSTVV